MVVGLALGSLGEFATVKIAETLLNGVGTKLGC